MSLAAARTAAWMLALCCMAAHAAPAQEPSAPTGAARYVAEWALQDRDNAGLPFAVIDKVEGRIFVFDGAGMLKASAPALTGSAPGDDTVPGIGEKPIASILPHERTTPAGRFEARMGSTLKGDDILWVDYESALALHRVATGVPKERRLQRLASHVPGDRRITYGCINVPAAFYDSVVRPTFAAGGVVYILPERRTAQELFGSRAGQASPQRAEAR